VLDRQVLHQHKPILGICLGMQLFAKSSEEYGIHAGFGWFDANVARFDLPREYKVPHVGWDALHFQSDDFLFRGINPHEANFYFVHSFHMHCRDPQDVVATCDYGGPFTAVVRRGNIIGTQFHPEKSQDNGIRLLQNFVDWTPT
jgi:glutamine amidotransferase